MWPGSNPLIHVPHNLLIGGPKNAFSKKHRSVRHTRVCIGRFCPSRIQAPFYKLITMEGIEVRACGPAETEKWADFLNRNFGYAAGQNYAIDFAPLFTADALARSRLAWKYGQIASSATLFPVTAVAPTTKIKLGIVGAVATDESFRGQGLSTRLLGELENLAHLSGLNAMILWSDQVEFYAKAGYEPVGQQHIYMLETLPKPDKLAPGTATYGWDWAQVRSLYEQHPLRMERGEQYWKALESIKSCTRVQWMDDQGKVKAYLGFDRGKDLHGIIHEWGGEAEALRSLTWIVLHNRPNLMWLTHPELNDPIRSLLTTPPVSQGTLGLVKILKPGLSKKAFDQTWFWGLDSL